MERVSEVVELDPHGIVSDSRNHPSKAAWISDGAEVEALSASFTAPALAAAAASNTSGTDEVEVGRRGSKLNWKGTVLVSVQGS